MLIKTLSKNGVGILFMVPVLTACANVSEWREEAQARAMHSKEELESKPVCCSDFEEMSFNSISASRTEINFDPSSSEVYEFATGKSYFYSFELPRPDNKAFIVLRSKMMDGGRGSIPTVFSPSIIYLDSNHDPLGPPVEIPICFFRGWAQSEVGYFGKIDRFPASGAYAVLFADMSSPQTTVPYSSQATVAGGGVMTSVRADDDFPKSVEGRVDIWIAEPGTLPGSLERECFNR